MASSSIFLSPMKLNFFLFVLVSSIVALPVPAFSLEFDVGGEGGWEVPSSKTNQTYNQWASKNRFNVGDIIRFKYKKDSVMVVTEQEYGKCKSTKPEFFSNNGDTEYKFTHSGTFYFISGVTGHCERGQKMVIRVISHAPGTSPPAPDSPDSSNSVAVSALAPLQALAAVAGGCLFYHGF